MAGSWNHMTTSSGKLRSNGSFTQLIENLGDAYEAAEECYGMVVWLADQLASEFETRLRGRDVIRKELIAEAVERYKDGLRIGGVQRER